MNPDLQRLQAYPFEKLAKLKAGATPPADLAHIALSIGEPKHAAPAFVRDRLIAHLDELSNYPVTKGMDTLRQVIASWLNRRFNLHTAAINPETQVLPVSGTREALFSFAQAVIDRTQQPLVLMPNPFYQIYEGAALLAGAEPYFMNTTQANNYLPDFDSIPAEVWRRCQLIYTCSPGNPTGAVMPLAQLQQLITLAEKYDFIIASDECYSELYFDETRPPPGLLEAAQSLGNTEYKRCVVFHSLSKRSNLPGLRSGFVAGDAGILADYYRYRTYHGCALPPPIQHASIAAWSDETHVRENRQLYQQKFRRVIELLQDVLPVTQPEGGFYLWPKLPVSDEQFTRDLFAQQNITVLPGRYLSRDAHGENPGANYIRMALVADLAQCEEAALRLQRFCQNL
ncbi:MAG: succinyldiaminopimelate transaminase [Gammaproteobacteria bacterium]|nr:succinyldiaminopimelate transaminase [Gammaproteobacteria bacterium]